MPERLITSCSVNLALCRCFFSFVSIITASFLKVTKQDVYTAVGLSRVAYYRYEKGEREPTAPLLIALADYFDVSLDYLVGRSDNPEVNK